MADISTVTATEWAASDLADLWCRLGKGVFQLPSHHAESPLLDGDQQPILLTSCWLTVRFQAPEEAARMAGIRVVTGHLSKRIPGGRDGYLSSDGAWTLSVNDDGNGRGAEADSKPGLGTGIVEALARQLDAQVQTESSVNGTKVSIVHTD